MKNELLDPLIICYNFAKGFHEFLCIPFPLKERCWEQNCFNEINGNNVNEICFKFLSIFGLSSVVLDGMELENVMIEEAGRERCTKG